MILHDVCAFQQVMLRSYVRNLMVCAGLTYIVAQEIRRKHEALPALELCSRLRSCGSTDVVSIASRSSGRPRGREIQAQAAGGAVLSYRAFASRVKRGMARTSSVASQSVERRRTMSETVQADRRDASRSWRRKTGTPRRQQAHLAARRKQIVIVGGGFAGIAAARALKRADADITLVDRRNHHIFQPLLYQVATAVLAPSEIAAPIRQLAHEQKNVSVLLAEVTGVDLKSRSIDASCPGAGIRRIPFDYLVIATGMRPSYFGHDEFAKYAPGLKTLSDAETIRAKILGAYELADTTDDDNERKRQMTFVLVGGGPTGVELAASLAQLATVTLRGQFRRIDPAESSIILVEGGKRILPTFADRLAAKAARRLEQARRQDPDRSEGGEG